MVGAHPLDTLIGNELPMFRSDADVRAFEQTPYADRVAARSTYEALQLGAGVDADAPAIHFLRTGEPDEVPATMSYRQFMGRVNQTANLLHDLGVGPGDTVSLMLPLIPQNCFALFGAEAAASRIP
jgi:fatty-acyl-CoA synthase